MKARMKTTVVDNNPRGGQATQGNVYTVLSRDGCTVTPRVPSRYRNVPKEFVVNLDNVVLLRDGD